MAQVQNQVAGIVQKIILKNPVMSLVDTFTKIPLVSQLSNHFSSIFLKSISNSWQKLLLLAGATTLTVGGFSLLKRITVILSIVIQHRNNETQAKSSAKLLKQKYGRDCWVVITGFTEGIGWALTNQFARLGMNLVLIGRNQQKIDKRMKFLQEKFPSGLFKVVVGDLSKVSDIQNIIEVLKNDIDIGILVNNAGLAGSGQFMKNSPQEILNILQTNWTSVVMLNNAIVPIMNKRQYRSAIINFSSSTGRFISPLLSSYPASKRMVNVYSEYLRNQNADKIDVMTVMPFGVITPMMRMIKDPAMITPQNCAKSVISDLLGKNLYTYGGLRHKIFGNIFANLTEEQGAKRLEAFWKKHT